MLLLISQVHILPFSEIELGLLIFISFLKKIKKGGKMILPLGNVLRGDY